MFFNMHHAFRKTAEARYIPVDKQYSEDDETDIRIQRPGRYQAAKKFLKIFVVGHIFLLAVGSASWYMWRHRPLNKSLKETSFYSPLLDKIQIPYHVRFNEPQTLAGSDWDMTWGSAPNPEIDKMWGGITNEATIPLTEAEVLGLKKDPSVAVMLPEEYHRDGEKTYLGHALVFHRLHCLDYIRKALYKDYYYPNGTEAVPMHSYHIAHCLAMILDHLTCAGDPGVYVYQWYEHTEIPLPDANTWGKCWDFGAFRKEFDKVALKNFTPFQLRKPPGAKSVREHNNLQEIIYQTQGDHSKGH